MRNELNNRIQLLLNKNTIKKNNKIISAGNNIMTTMDNTDEVRDMMGLNGGAVRKSLLKELKQFNKNKGKGMEKLEGGFLPLLASIALPLAGRLAGKMIDRIGNGKRRGGAMLDMKNLEDLSDDAEKSLKGGASVDKELLKELKQLDTKNGEDKLVGGFLPLLASIALPLAGMVANKIVGRGQCGGAYHTGGAIDDVEEDEEETFDDADLPRGGSNILATIGRYVLCDRKGSGMMKKHGGYGEIAFANDLGNQRAFSLKSLPKSKAIKDGARKGSGMKGGMKKHGGDKLPTMEFSTPNMTGNIEFVEPSGRQSGNIYGMRAKKLGGARMGGMRCGCQCCMKGCGKCGGARMGGSALDTDMVLTQQQASAPSQGGSLFSSLGSIVDGFTGFGKTPKNKKVPKGFHIMPDGSLMKNSDHKGGSLFSSLGSIVDGFTGFGKKPRRQTPAMKKGTQALMAYQAKLKKLKSQGMSHKEAQEALRKMKD